MGRMVDWVQGHIKDDQGMGRSVSQSATGKIDTLTDGQICGQIQSRCINAQQGRTGE